MCPGVRWVPGCSVFLPADFDHDRQCYRQCGDVAKVVEHMIAAANAAAFRSGDQNVIHARQDDPISMQTLTVKLAATGNEPVLLKGNLNLSSQNLSSLPEPFGNLIIGGDLHLDTNQLKSLPESFGNLIIGGDLYLQETQLESLPASFGNLIIGGDLLLSDNQLESLPESFGNLKVGGNLLLSRNQLGSLPKSFDNIDNITVGLNLDVFGNAIDPIALNCRVLQAHRSQVDGWSRGGP